MNISNRMQQMTDLRQQKQKEEEQRKHELSLKQQHGFQKQRADNLQELSQQLIQQQQILIEQTSNMKKQLQERDQVIYELQQQFQNHHEHLKSYDEIIQSYKEELAKAKATLQPKQQFASTSTQTEEQYNRQGYSDYEKKTSVLRYIRLGPTRYEQERDMQLKRDKVVLPCLRSVQYYRKEILAKMNYYDANIGFSFNPAKDLSNIPIWKQANNIAADKKLMFVFKLMLFMLINKFIEIKGNFIM
ncbi:Hypothetical_protein [Hexamita inflata]|uniref:Hypothetical_protein n=1 Tax=Hexamita inflata TaxID=28002 RepID=A0AA86PTH3_9EUKA|nr:Hypothetical protein HINF_LOCUS32156 [Hexamita inflata]